MITEPGEEGEALQDDPDLLETAVFGREVEQFIEHDRIGQYLKDKALADLTAAHDALVQVDPTDYRKIAALQLEARVAERVRGWLSDAIEAGRQATVVLQQERDQHA